MCIYVPYMNTYICIKNSVLYKVKQIHKDRQKMVIVIG